MLLAVAGNALGQATQPVTSRIVHPAMLSGPERLLAADRLGAAALNAYDAGEFQTANSYAEQAMQFRMDQPDATIVMAMLMTRAGMYREALPLLERYIKNPDRGVNDYRGYETLGDIYLRSNQPRLALNHYKLALPKAQIMVGRRPVQAEITMKFSEAAASLGMCKEAVESAEIALASLPRSGDLQWRLAQIYLKCQKPAEAERAMEATVKQLLTEVEAHAVRETLDIAGLSDSLRTLVAISKKRYELFEDDARKVKSASELTPFRAKLARNLAESCEYERRLQLVRAVAFMSDAIRAEPKNVDHYLDFAKYAVAAELRPAAVSSLRAALALEPSNPRVAEQLRRLGIAPTTQAATVRR